MKKISKNRIKAFAWVILLSALTGITLTAARFQASQVGTVRPGLTLDGGTLVVTDNYLKVRIPPGRNRNERVNVRIVSATHGELVGS